MRLRHAFNLFADDDLEALFVTSFADARLRFQVVPHGALFILWSLLAVAASALYLPRTEAASRAMAVTLGASAVHLVSIFLHIFKPRFALPLIDALFTFSYAIQGAICIIPLAVLVPLDARPQGWLAQSLLTYASVSACRVPGVLAALAAILATYGFALSAIPQPPLALAGIAAGVAISIPIAVRQAYVWDGRVRGAFLELAYAVVEVHERTQSLGRVRRPSTDPLPPFHKAPSLPVHLLPAPTVPVSLAWPHPARPGDARPSAVHMHLLDIAEEGTPLEQSSEETGTPVPDVECPPEPQEAHDAVPPPGEQEGDLAEPLPPLAHDESGDKEEPLAARLLRAAPYLVPRPGDLFDAPRVRRRSRFDRRFANPRMERAYRELKLKRDYGKRLFLVFGLGGAAFILLVVPISDWATLRGQAPNWESLLLKVLLVRMVGGGVPAAAFLAILVFRRWRLRGQPDPQWEVYFVLACLCTQLATLAAGLILPPELATLRAKYEGEIAVIYFTIIASAASPRIAVPVTFIPVPIAFGLYAARGSNLVGPYSMFLHWLGLSFFLLILDASARSTFAARVFRRRQVAALQLRGDAWRSPRPGAAGA